MRVGVDISCLKGPMGGYERYAVSLLRALADLPGSHEIVVFTDRRYGACVVPAGTRIECRQVRTLPRFIAKVMLQDQTYWPLLFRRARVDVVHTPIFAGMAYAPRPYVLTLHDLIPLRRPETLSRSAAWYWRTILPRAVGRAAVIITDSEFSRQEICAEFGLSPERVVAIPLGVDPRFRPIGNARQLAEVRRRYRLPEEFLLSVGIASPRKNLERLARIFAALPDDRRGGAQLVIVGPPGWRNAELERALASPAAAGRIQRLGIVDEEDMPALYSLARGAVSLSLYEGFGLPALEALACATPLVCSSTTAFPEVVGECALLVDPLDDAAIAAALTSLVSGGDELSARAACGVARAARFTWQRTAQATLAVYRRAAV